MKHPDQTTSIQRLRSANYSYTQIAKILNIPVNTVRSICRRNGFAPNEPNQIRVIPFFVPSQELLVKCRYCGKLTDNPNHRQKAFCSNKCRYDYWNREKRLRGKALSEPLENLSEKPLDFLAPKSD